jgi:hypothetical protein
MRVLGEEKREFEQKIAKDAKGGGDVLQSGGGLLGWWAP